VTLFEPYSLSDNRETLPKYKRV